MAQLKVVMLAGSFASCALKLHRQSDLKEVDILGWPRLLDERTREGVRVDAGEAHVQVDLPGHVE